MPFNPKTTREILEIRGVDEAQMASAAAISEKRWEEMLEGTRTPSARQVERLAYRLAVPPYAFFMSEFLPDEPNVPLLDFRQTPATKFKPGLHSRFFARFLRWHQFATELRKETPPATRDLVLAEPNENPEQLAHAYRALLQLDDFQFDQDLRAGQFYSEFKRRVEELGVFVVQDSLRDPSIRGFALFDKDNLAHSILINTYSQNHYSRVFTLAHELAHIVLRQSGVSDVFDLDSEVEVYCNRFAINLLAPRAQFGDVARSGFDENGTFDQNIAQARSISRYFRVSIAATLLRLAELGFARPSVFKRWMDLFRSDPKASLDAKNDILRSKEPPDLGKAAIARTGLRFAQALRTALNSQSVTPYEVYERIGLPKKTLDALIKATPAELQQAVEAD